MSKQMAFYFQQEHCVGCATCQIACKDKNDLDVGQLFRKIHEFSGGNYNERNGVISHNVYAYWLSLTCNHCQEPLCVKNCPSGAMKKRSEDGIVYVDTELCIGCKYCVMSCPYSAPQYNEKKGKMGKCDFCRDLLAKGEKPACVSSCPMRVLGYGELAELQKKHGKTNVVQGMPLPNRTNPSLVITPHRDAITGK